MSSTAASSSHWPRHAPDYEAPLPLYLEQLDRNGLTHGVLVQPSFLGTDNSYLVECLKQEGGRLRGIAVVDPAITADELRALDRAGVVGIRLNLVGQPLPDLAAREWTALLASVKAMGWQVEVQRNAADLAVLVPQLLDHGVTVVLDHYALPDPKLGVADPGFQSVLKLGATKNVWVKISAPYRNGAAGEFCESGLSAAARRLRRGSPVVGQRLAAYAVRGFAELREEPAISRYADH